MSLSRSVTRAKWFGMAIIKKDTLVQVAVSKRERDRWKAFANQLDLTVSEFVREAVRARMAGVITVLDVAQVRTAMQRPEPRS
jgi:hypothetical protein